MAYAAVTFLLENLKVEQYASLISQYSNSQIDELKKLLIRLQGLYAPERPTNEQLAALENKVKEAIAEVEDIIDASITMSRSRISAARRALKTSRGRLEVPPPLKDAELKSLIDQVENKLHELPVLNHSSSTNILQTHKAPIDGKANGLKVEKRNTDGLKVEKDRIINDLNRESEKLEVVSITGMPGVGKTTLAKRIFQAKRIREEFPVCIWIYVSPELTGKQIFLSILEEFTHQDMSAMSIEELEAIVSDYLRLGKFLIVMDDLQTTTTGAWPKFQQVLPRQNKLGRVLITTSNSDVALTTFSIAHEKLPLTDERSWELLQEQVFGLNRDCPHKLEGLGKTIAKACDGLPLSVVVIGRVLAEKLSSESSETMEKEWQEVYTTCLIDNQHKVGLGNIISKSYDTLPADMRDCFLYLGIFPQGIEIPVKTLTWLWISEGFISKPGKTMEEAAKNCLKELFARNLLMVDKTSINGGVKSCRVHNKVREFCKTKAVEQNLFNEITRLPAGSYEPPILDLQSSRRLSIHSNVPDFHSQELKKARSFLCFSRSPLVLDTKDSSRFGESFSLVRVLDTNSIKFPKYPTKIAKLIHLRYVTLSVEELKILPETVSNLWNLETLIVNTSSNTLEIKMDIWKMMRLRHLKTKASIILKNKTAGDGGDNLQTLTKLSPQSSTDAVFKKAKNLKKLGIHGNLLHLSDSTMLEALRHLEKLTLEHDIPRMHHEKSLLELPKAQKFPPFVKFLVLAGTSLEWQKISTVSELPNLKVLKLKNNAFMGESWDVEDWGFQRLEALSINKADLKYWSASSNSFPKLKNLHVKNCEKLQEIPPDVVKNRLEMLSMYRVTIYAVSSAMEIKQDRARTAFKLKVAHTFH